VASGSGQLSARCVGPFAAVSGPVCVTGRARVDLRSADETEVCTMSGTDKMKDKAQELAGRGKEAVGDATDNRDLQAEGQKDQAAGNLKQAGEKVKDVFK
jgi:uncharacterized protein YjbJ (UPF0337 family)